MDKPALVSAPELLPVRKRLAPPAKAAPVTGHPCPVPVEPGSRASVIPFKDRVAQLGQLWKLYVEVANQLGCTVRADGLNVVETHAGYVLDARLAVVDMRAYLDELRRIWPHN